MTSSKTFFIHKYVLFVILLGLGLAACSQSATCPAFQSSFILDDSLRDARFSYFNEDSVPDDDKFKFNGKNKFGIALNMKTEEKEKWRAILKKETIFPPNTREPDSTISIAIPGMPQSSESKEDDEEKENQEENER